MLALAQGSRYQSYALDQSGHPLGNLSIRVCAVPIIATPCPTLAALATDATLGVSAPNPVTTDSVGNFSFYTAPGFYHLQYYSAASLIYEEDIQVSLTTPTGQVNATFVDASVGYKVAGSYGANGTCLVSTGTTSVWGACASGGAGTVTTVGDLPPLFTTATRTTTPAFSLTAAAANTVFGNNTGGSATPGFQSLVLSQLPSSGAHTISTTAPLGGGGSVALGGTLTLTCTTCLTSVTAHNLLSATHGDTTAAAAVRGDGIFAIGASPTWQRLAHPATSGGYFKWNGTDIVASSLAASGTGSPTTCTNQVVTAFTLSGDAAPTSTCTTITSAFTSGTFTATAHALLSAIHSDTTVGTVARGDVVTGQGASPTWTRLAKGTANQILAMDGTGTDVIWAPAPAGTGTVTSIATTSPISGGTITTTGTISCPNCVDKTASNNYSASTTQAMDTITAKYWGGAPVFDVSRFPGVDWCAKVLAVYSDAAYIAASKAILDATGLTGSQTCAAGSTTLSATKPVHWILGQMTLSLPNSGVSFLDINGVQTSLAAPVAPTLATATTGGSLAAATTYGVKVSYSNLTGETLPSTETTKLTGAGTTNTITVTSPANSTSLQCYNVYSATPVGSGWKLNNTTGCIPLGTSYVIKTVGAGTIPLTTGTAWEGMFEFEGQGDSTIISEDSVNSPILEVTNNVYMHNFKIVSSQTANNNGSIWINAANDVWLDHITCAGGGNCIFVAASNRIHISNIHYGNPTISPASAVLATSSTNVDITRVVLTGGVWPTTGTGVAGVEIQSCIQCSITSVTGDHLDMSNAFNGGMVTVDNSRGFVINDIHCEFLINADCVATIDLAFNGVISNVSAANTNINTGVGPNLNNGDCVDAQNVGEITFTNIMCKNIGLNANNTRFPAGEFYNDMNISLTNFSAFDGNGEGVKVFGTPGMSITDPHISRNWSAGITLQDGSTTVNCNNTTTVTYVANNGFGPWVPGTVINIGASAFFLASTPTSTTGTLTLTAACNLGAGQSLVVYSQDVNISNPKIDDNGQNSTGAGARTGSTDGISFTGHSIGTVIGGSINDNAPVLANKHQQYAIRAENSAVFTALFVDGSNNAGGSSCLFELAPQGATTKWFCDSPKLSSAVVRDGTTNRTLFLTPATFNTGGNDQAQASIVADSAAINTTETIIVKTATLPANRLIAGTHIRATLTGTCTTTVANTSTFTIRMGTAGTTSDTAIATPVTTVAGTTGTNIPFKMVLEFTVRTVGASGTGSIEFGLDSNGLTGIVAAQTPQLLFPAMSTFNTTTANNILSISYKSAATTTTSTFKNAVIEIVQN